MTVTDRTVPSQGDTVEFELDLPHAPDKVWRALTEPTLLAEWLLPVFDLRLARGAEFTFRTQPQPGWNGTVHCQLEEIDPPRTLRYTWVVGDMGLHTVVSFALTPTAAGTRLRLVQSGFTPDQKRNFGGARYGWKMMGEKLVDLLARIP